MLRALVLLLYSSVGAFSSFHRHSSSSSSSSSTTAKLRMSVITDDIEVIGKKSRAIPKEETNLYELYKNFGPNSDGKGIKIAILDTGCDLNAAGLNGTTSDGITPKYIDFLDCTGDGDIDMDVKPVEFDYNSNSIVKGLSGRNVTLGEWARDIKSIKLGAVRLYDLLPRGVMRRVKKERKEIFVAKHQALISNVQSKLDNLPKKEDKNKSSDNNNNGSKEEGGDGEEDEKKKIGIQKKEFQLLLEQLKDVESSYEDYGPLLDIVMFEEEGIWKAVIDVQANGDLSNSIPMSSFRYARQIGELGFGSAVTYCIQVYDNGKILSIVTDAGSHGTHVAGIAAANFEGSNNSGREEDINGVAPGAQILALKIGDGRLGSTETGAGLTRALVAAKKYGCHVLNLSYGESSWQFNSGRVAQVFATAVHDWGMAVFTSAGNDGPALSSIGSPGSESAPITVGAWVSPEMMKEQYSTLPPHDDDDPLEGASYYFSSRGPTPDGALPDICAPGGAISPIPRHSLQAKAQYHGTSMSSPNACGVAACILSAVKQKGVDCNPIELKRALINTAAPNGIVDVFAQGPGVVSANKCAEYIVSHHGKVGQNIPFDVSIPARNNARGIYIRDEIELEGPMTFTVQINPKFSHSKLRTSSEMDELLNLELNLLLKANADWVVCPDSMTLLSATERNGQTFSVRLNTQTLSPGVHYSTVDAIDANDPSRGAMFSLPITVIVPHSKYISNDDDDDDESVTLKENGLDLSTTFHLKPGLPKRRFVTIPSGAEWATIKLRGKSPTDSAASPRIYLHAVPFVRGDLPNSLVQMKRVYQIKDGVEEEYHMRVKGGHTLELCLQLLWLANPSPANVTADIEWHSLDIRSPTLVNSQPVTISSAREFARLGVNTPLRAEKLNPSANLKSVRRTLRPQEYDITLGSNELLDCSPASDADIRANPDEKDTQIYEMRTRYKFSVKTEKDNKAIPVMPSCPSLFNQLYDSAIDSQLWSLEDSESQVLEYGGAIHHVEPLSLKKGDYTLCLLLRHPNRKLLEQMKDIPCELLLTLPDSLPCEVYSQMDKASTPSVTEDGRSVLKSATLRKGTHQDLYVSRPTKELPSWIEAGDVLVGSLLLDKGKERVTSIELLYNAPPKPAAKDSKEDKAVEKKTDSLDDVVFKAKLDFLAGLRKNSTKAEEYENLYDTLKEDRPMNVPLLLERLTFALQRPVPPAETDENKWRAKEVELVYKAMLKENDGPIDVSLLAQYFGVKEPDKDELEDNEEAKKMNKDMKEQRAALKKIMLSRASIAGSIVDKDASAVDEFDKAVKEMKKWVSPDNLDDDKDKAQLAITLAQHAICQNKKSTALSLLLKARKDLTGKDLKKIDEELAKVFAMIGDMDHLIENVKEGLQTRYPTAPRKL